MSVVLEALLEASVRVLVLAAVVGLVLGMVRVRNGGVLHAAWTAVLCAMLLMPVLPYAAPEVSVPVPVPAARFAPEFSLPPETPPWRPAVVKPATATPESPAPPPKPAPVWPLVPLWVYVAGVTAMLYRMLAGWRSARQLARESAPVLELSADGPVYESALLVTPLTVSVFTPRITLPVEWRDWSADKLSAVLAHERAHASRRDPLVRLLAHVNRCVFWFHPLAWWMERKLATTAEYACDEAGIRAVGESRKYAEVLLDLAETVRRRGGRVQWHGMGIDGAGMLGDRIDHILRGDFFRSVSRTRKVLIAVSCALAILLVAACRRKSVVAPLQDDPKIVADRAAIEARQAFYQVSVSLRLDQVAEMEAALKQNPDDLESHRKLILFYMSSGQGKLGELPAIAARRPHILWMIEHHPEDELEAWAAGQISPTALDPLPDPTGYSQAKKAWLEQTKRPGVSARVLGNAASFLRLTDKPLAEQLLLRAQSLDPGGPWAGQLGRLYYEAIVGSNARQPLGVIRAVSMIEAHGAYADSVRRKLAASDDARLLYFVGQSLVIGGLDHYRMHRIDFDPLPLGKSYLERAIQIDPKLSGAHRAMLYAQRQERGFRQVSYEEVSRLTPSERFVALARVAENTYIRADMDDYYKHDTAAARSGWEHASQYAREALQLGSGFQSDPDYGTAFFKSNMVLGMVAMRNGRQQEAVHYMLEASKAPSSEELTHMHQYLSFKLPEVLLKYGERATVVEFLERFSKVNISERTYLLESADLIRHGRKPAWYRA